MPVQSFRKLLKKYTDIDKKFIDIFFKKFKVGEELSYHIDEIDVADYLDIQIKTLRNRLRNVYSKNDNFWENVDYVRKKTNKGTKYFLNYECFEKICMMSDTERADSVRMYFAKLRRFISDYSDLIYNAVEDKEELRKISKKETIYFFAADERFDDIYKIGRTQQIIKRLNNYNVGRIREAKLKYLAVVTNSIMIENCMKLKLEKNQVRENKEIYLVSPQKLKKIIDDCYCKHVSSAEHKKLYEDLSNLTGLYSYVKDKVKIKPFVIIKKF